LYIYIYIECRS